jgi:lipopolysaccharide export system permease protein
MKNEVSLENKRTISLTIFRYIFSEMLFSFAICFCFFFFIFFVNQILLMAQEILTKRVPFYQVSLLVLYSLPSIIALSAPFASLVGTIMTVGRLTSDNEILILLSSGLSYISVFFPAILIGILISLLSFFTNDVLLPAGTVEFNKLWRRILLSIPALELEAHSVKRFKDTVVITGNVTGNAIENLIILDKTDDGERRLIMANSAELKDSGNQGLSLELDEAFFHSSKDTAWDDYDYARTTLLQYRVSNEDLMEATVSVSPREMSSRDVIIAIRERRVVVNNRLDSRKFRMISAAYSLENILREGSEGYSWNSRASNVSSFMREYMGFLSIKDDQTLTTQIIELYRKSSVPFGAFFFVFLAVSLGLMAKKSGQTLGFIFGNIIAVIYWSMLFVGQTMALRVGSPPFWSMWLPNILSLSAGVVLAIIKVRK